MVLDLLLKNTPCYIYSFTKTSVKVTNCTTLTGAVITAAKSILINCTLPHVRYPVLCAGFALSAVGNSLTGNPYSIAATVNLGECILNS
jgi:hypothetical protein